jgi:16S rRNA (uracil1498-N3)-methyltransferase
VARELSPRKLERLRAIAREAAEQSERGRVPPIASPTSLSAILRPDMTLLYERHTGQRLSDLAPPTAVVVGPEGGFTDAEVTMAVDAGVEIAGLGARILRSQTVAASVAATILARTRDFG